MRPGRRGKQPDEWGISLFARLRGTISPTSAFLPSPPSLAQGGRGVSLTKRDNDGAGDAVCHDYSEDTHHPGISSPKLELVGLVLQGEMESHEQENPES